jgi:hypothetical protein
MNKYCKPMQKPAGKPVRQAIRRPIERQRGSVLLVSLIFMMVIALMGLTSMQTSKLEMRMSMNEEMRTSAFEIAQAMADAIVATPAMTPVVGGAGYTLCTPGQPNCDLASIFMPQGDLSPEVAAGHLSATAVLLAPGGSPPPRGLGFSADKFAASGFQVTTSYDRGDEGLGASTLNQGLLILTPAE